MTKEQRNMITAMYKEGKYQDSIKMCKSLLFDIDNEDRWFVFIETSKCHRKLGQYKEALKNANNAVIYASNSDEYIKNLWMLSNIFDDMGDSKKALRFCEKCIDHYKRNNDYLHLGDCLKNKSIITKKPEITLTAIGMHLRANADISIIDDDYDSMHDVYVALDDYNNAYKALCNIQDKELRIKLQELLATNFNREVVNI